MPKNLLRWVSGGLIALQVLAFQNCSQFTGTQGNSENAADSLSLSSSESSVDLLPDPGFLNPRLKVHAGKIENFMPKVELPHMNLPPYDVSGWTLTQWRKQVYIMPSDIMSSNEVDPVLGAAVYSMKASSQESELKMFKHPSSGGFVFELTGRQGWLAAGGGSNVFISADIIPGRKNTFDGKMTLSLESKLLTSKALESVSGASRDGSVVGQYFSGFTVSYEDPTGRLPRTGLFIQIHHADTRGRLGGAYRGCYPHNGYQEIVYNHTLPGDHFYNSVSGTTESLGRREFDVNRYLCEALSQDFTCIDESGNRSTKSFKEYTKDLSRWKVGSYYTGLETQAAFGSATVPSAVRGSTEMKVQIAGVRLIRDNTATFASCDDYLNGNSRPVNPTTPVTPVNPENPPVAAKCSSGTFLNGTQPIEYKCDCGNPAGEGWVQQNATCYHRVVKDSFFCGGGNKVYFRCDAGNPGEGWVDVGGGCFHLGTQEKCQ